MDFEMWIKNAAEEVEAAANELGGSSRLKKPARMLTPPFAAMGKDEAEAKLLAEDPEALRKKIALERVEKVLMEK